MTSNSENLLDYIKRCNYYHMLVVETTGYPNSPVYSIKEDDAGPSHYWYSTNSKSVPGHWYTTNSVVWFNGGN